jgi:hypothetical protein
MRVCCLLPAPSQALGGEASPVQQPSPSCPNSAPTILLPALPLHILPPDIPGMHSTLRTKKLATTSNILLVPAALTCTRSGSGWRGISGSTAKPHTTPHINTTTSPDTISLPNSCLQHKHDALLTTKAAKKQPKYNAYQLPHLHQVRLWVARHLQFNSQAHAAPTRHHHPTPCRLTYS